MRGNRVDLIIGAGIPFLSILLFIATLFGWVTRDIGIHGMVLLLGIESVYFSSRSYRGNDNMVITIFYAMFGTLLILFGVYGLYGFVK